MVFISSFYIAGIIAYLNDAVIIFAFIALIALLVGIWKNLFSNRAAILLYLFFTLALLNCSHQIKQSDALSHLAPAKGHISGTVISIPTTNYDHKTKFYLRVNSATIYGKTYENLKSKTIVTLNDTKENFESINIGDKLELDGRLSIPMRAVNPSQFDYRNYLKYNKTFTTFYVKGGNWKEISGPEHPGLKFLQHLNIKRQDIINIHKKYMKSPNIEVLGGIVFGDDAVNPPNEIRTSFINSGLLHILAASGMNVSIIFGIWFFIGTRMRLNYRLVILIGAVLVGFYTLMTGMGASVLRAALMIEFVLLGKLIDRNADGVALLFFVGLLLLIYNPAMIMEVGFQLSFVVTFALIFSCPPLLTKIENKYLEFIAGTLMIPIVAQFWAAPIQMFYFNNVSTYSIFANILITPFIMVISFLGFASSILAMIPLIADKVCMISDFILNPVVSGLVNISNFFSNMPHSLLITPHPGIIQVILYYCALLAIGFLVKENLKHPKWLAASFVLLFIFGLSLIKFDSGKCEVLAFSVGNADSFLIKTPKKKYILIDTAHGSNGNNTFSQADAIINKYLKDNGIKHLDLMIVTHFDSDHSGGAADILSVIKADKVLISSTFHDTKTSKTLMTYLKESKINYESAKNNETVLEEKDLSVKTFVPDLKLKNDNESSTLALLSYKDFDMLFMADGSVQSFEKVKNNLPKNIEVLKIGHHGAENTVNKKMFDDYGFKTVIVSTGYNTYGHPKPRTMEILMNSGAQVMRTDSNNAVKIVTDGEKYKVLKFLPKKKKFECEHEGVPR